MNDLRELYEHRRARDGDRAARTWLRRQLTKYPYRLIFHRFLRTTHGEPRHNHSKDSMQNLFRDFKHSLRSLVRTPVLTATIVLTVGLGIGSTTAIFSVINAVLIQPLPYLDPGQLVRVYTDSPPNRWPLSVADYLALDAQQTSFSRVAGYQNSRVTFTRGDVAERVLGRFVTWTYFPLLGITPLHGRLFSEADDLPGADGTVVLSHGFWTRYLGGDENAIGQTIRLNSTEFTVIGVLPREVGPFEQDREFFAAARWGIPPRKGPFFITALARLNRGTELATAKEELRAINRRIFPIWQASYADQTTTWGTMDLKQVVVGDVGTTMVIVLAAVGFVLLIACTNAANLLVARATHRSRELAVRNALGASRRRLLQHLLSESVLLAGGGALMGLVLTVAGIMLVTTAGADFIPRTHEIALNGMVLSFLGAITTASGLLFGLIPALHGARSRFDQDLRSGGRSASDSGPRQLRRALVIAQFAVAAPLLIGAGLLIGSLTKLQHVDPGFDTRNLLTAAVSLPVASYQDTSDVRALWDQFTARVEGLPGVVSVGFSNARPPNQLIEINNFNLEDQPTPPGQIQPTSPWVAASAGYFKALGISLLRGRLFDERDGIAAQEVVVVDQVWANRFFPNENPIGKRLQDGGAPSWTTIVGVVSDVKYMGLESSGDGTVYRPMPAPSNRFRYLVARTSTDPMGLVPAIRQIVRELDPTLPLSGVATIDELMTDSLDTPRYLAILVGAFAAVALLLSVIGIYGVMAYFVQQHTKDIGIRIALGGGPSNVLRMIIGQGMRLVGVGVLVGIVGALMLTRYMSSVLFEVGATDPFTFLAVSATMLAVAVLACFVPARRAAGVDPARTLRDE